MNTPHEIEVKIAVQSAARIRRLLRENGFVVSARRIFESNTVLDDKDGSIKARNMLLRLRAAGIRVTCTWKGREMAGPHKRREEREFHPREFDNCLAVFKGLGYEPSFRYEKYRTEFARAASPGHVMLDETPIGIFMELEGPARWIDRTARELGFSRENYILLSYGRLFEAWCAERGIQSREMTFSA